MGWRAGVVSIVVATGVLVPVGAAEAAAPCAAPKRFSKVIVLPPKASSLHKATKKHPGGWVRGRYAKLAIAGEDPYLKKVGLTRNVYFAKKYTICLWRSATDDHRWVKGTRKGLLRSITHPVFNDGAGLVIKKGRIVKIYQVSSYDLAAAGYQT